MNRAFVLGLLLVIASSVVADDIGLYFDPTGTANCVAANNGDYVSAYLVVSDLSLDDVRGFEAMLEWDSGIFVSLYGLQAGGVNFGVFPELRVGYQTPIPTATSVILAEFRILNISGGGISLFAIDSPSIPDAVSPVIAGGEAVDLVESSLARANPVAIIGTGSCAGYVDGGQASSSSVEFIVLDESTSLEPSYSTVLPHGNGVGEVGYVSDIPLPYGVTDFDVDANGYTYILDDINRRVVVLDEKLDWIESFRMPESATKIKCDNGVYVKTLSSRVYRLQEGQLERAEHYFGLERGRYLQKGPAVLDIDGSRLSPLDYELEISGGVQGERFEFPNWRVSLPRPAHGMGLAVASVIAGSIFLRADYDLGDRRCVASIYRIGVEGEFVSRIQLPDFSDVDHRLPISAKVGAAGDVVTMKVYTDRTEVFKWNAF